MIDLYLIYDNSEDLQKIEDIINSNYYLHHLNINKHVIEVKLLNLKENGLLNLILLYFYQKMIK